MANAEIETGDRIVLKGPGKGRIDSQIVGLVGSSVGGIFVRGGLGLVTDVATQQDVALVDLRPTGEGNECAEEREIEFFHESKF
jgi:hypothetical protein